MKQYERICRLIAVMKTKKTKSVVFTLEELEAVKSEYEELRTPTPVPTIIQSKHIMVKGSKF